MPEDRGPRQAAYNDGEKEEKGIREQAVVGLSPSNHDHDHDLERQDLARRTSSVSGTGTIYSVFTPNQKRFIIVMASFAGFFSPVSGQIYFPALNDLARDLHVSNTLINLTLTSYMIFQGIAPTLIGDLADTMGRRPAYLVCFIIYIAANIGLALQNSYPALFVLRCLQSSGSSGTIAMASGVVSDVATAAERGTYIGFTLAGALLGPAIGPVLGGVLAQYLGWRSIFWFLTITGATFLLLFAVFFPETARNQVGNGSVPPKGRIYHFDSLHIGLCYLPAGLGSMTAALSGGIFLDRNFARWCRRLNLPPISKNRNHSGHLRHFPFEKARLQVAIPAAYVTAALVLVFGWVLDAEGPLAVVLVVLFFATFHMGIAFNVTTTLLVDFYPNATATATAANNLCRCLLGAGMTAAIVPMIESPLRCGGSFSIMSGLLILTSPLLWVIYWRGHTWREQRRLRAEKKIKSNR
ncbi:hypothetical protein DV736_g1022, partial [Chaetothyriales sp. CBS 134916]